jgi:uncharacterized protein (DUF433 family)
MPSGSTPSSSILDWNQCPTVERVPGRVSGAWLFKGTRVPVKALFEHLEAGAGVDDSAVVSERAGAGARGP